MHVHKHGIIFVLMIWAHAGPATGSIGIFLPFSGFYPIFGETPQPVNIFTKATYPLYAPKPLVFTGNNGKEQAYIRNTGVSLEVFKLDSSTTFTVTGGPLYGNVYRFRKTVFYWASSTNKAAYSTINGKGSCLVAVVIFCNLKYGPLETAVKFRDGLVSAIFEIEVGSKTNPKFEPLADAIRKIKNPGPFVPIQLNDTFNFYKGIPKEAEYFAYPGSYTNETTSQTYDCTTTISVVPQPKQYISKKQFTDTFLKLRDFNGNTLITQEPQHGLDFRPVARGQGIKLKYTQKTVYNNMYD